MRLQWGWILVGLSVAVSASASDVKSIFLPERAFIILTNTAMQEAPRTAEDLYGLVAMEPEETPGGGRGKIVKSAEEDFTLSCVERETRMKSWICQMAFKASGRIELDPAAERAVFQVVGEEAKILFMQFKSQDGLGVAFATDTFQIEASETSFRVVFDK